MGIHLISDLNTDKVHSLTIKDYTVFFQKLLIDLNHTILHTAYHQFEPQGLSLFFLLGESHLSIHTYPENNLIAFDFYSCKKLETEEIKRKINDFLETNGEYSIINRI
jgi:S-adenosylmethionine/arginine decarboxylase-like enzyme